MLIKLNFYFDDSMVQIIVGRESAAVRVQQNVLKKF